MKNTYKYIIALSALICACTYSAQAQESGRLDNDGVSTSKTVSGPDKDGIYTLTLESWVTGQTITTTVEERVPVDVVLLLDASGSMDDNFGSRTGWRAYNQGFSLNTIQNDDYYYLWTDGNYYKVTGKYCKRTGYKRRTWLWFEVGGTTRYYLRGSSVIQARDRTDPTYDGRDGNKPYDINGNTIEPIEDDMNSSNKTVWTGTLYRYQSTTISKMEALQDAVASFVGEIQQDAIDNELDNTVSIVKFADDSYKSGSHLIEGNDKNSSGYNYTQLVKNFTNVRENTGTSAVIAAVNAIDPAGATAADYGMDLVAEVLSQNINHIIYSSSDEEYSKERKSAKVVIMFTDGDPNHGSGFNTTVASNTVKSAHDLKKDGVIIYTIGTFTSPSDREKQYMDAVSSNKPDATEYTHGSTNTMNMERSYFYNSDGDIDLSSIFTSIAQEIQTGGAAVQTLGETSLILDVVTDSFQLPAGANTSSIKMYTSEATVNSEGVVTAWAPKVAAPNSVAPNAEVVKAAMNTDGTTDIIVKGFDFTAHWVGKGCNDPYKFIIEVPIIPKADAVGGEEIETNTALSGIYLPDPEDEDKPGEAIEDYEIPSLDLPVKIQITKSGLEEGESATFIISRRPTSNASASFTYFTTVMLTGVGTGEDNPIVVLKDLDPHYIYQITEGDWSWTYSISNETGETQTTEGVYLNPFTFSNAKKNTDIPQNNAEATVHNVFEKSN